MWEESRTFHVNPEKLLGWLDRDTPTKFLEGTFLCFLVVRHRSVLVERPKADLGVNLENPLLAFRRMHSKVI